MSEPDPNRLVLTGVTRRYAGQSVDRAALADVDLDVPAGRFVTIIGPSGCGKSTLLRLVAGLDRPDEGDIAVFGDSPQGARRTKTIGLVPQRPALFPWLSVIDNVTLPLRVNRRRTRTRGPDPRGVLATMGLADALPQRPRELSGGMQQRVAVARAFVLAPRVLLMDEPFAALDEFTREALQGQLLDLWQQWQTTVIFVTHSIREAVLLGDTVVVMTAQPGRIAMSYAVDLPRPRSSDLIGSAELRSYEDRLRAAMQPAAVAV